IAVYILYFLGLIESVLLPTNGIIMVLGFALVLFQSDAIKESSYIRHYWWLIICTVILLLFTFLNFTAPIEVENTSFKFQTKYIGQLIYFILVSYGFFCLFKNKQLPDFPPSKNNKNLPSKK
ncbi:MAG: hypothetical protein N4Q30_08385, partial [Neisseriaceae bacterium]|nr:hypothetical protein [Neisseriaceae bacterium]